MIFCGMLFPFVGVQLFLKENWNFIRWLTSDIYCYILFTEQEERYENYN